MNAKKAGERGVSAKNVKKVTEVRFVYWQKESVELMLTVYSSRFASSRAESSRSLIGPYYGPGTGGKIVYIGVTALCTEDTLAYSFTGLIIMGQFLNGSASLEPFSTYTFSSVDHPAIRRTFHS